MTPNDIIRMARKSQKESFVGDTGHWFKMEIKDLGRFYDAAFAAGAAHERDKATEYRLKLENVLAGCESAVLAERDACAKVCDDYAEKCLEAENWEAEDVSLHCAAAIRARGQE